MYSKNVMIKTLILSKIWCFHNSDYKNILFWDVTLCCLLGTYWCCRRTWPTCSLFIYLE